MLCHVERERPRQGAGRSPRGPAPRRDQSIARMTAVEWVGRQAVVTVRGEVDAFNAPEIRLELRRLIEAEGARTLIIDLTDVTFLDSSALGALVGTVRRLNEHDGQLKIVRPKGGAARIFQLTGLDSVLDLYDDRRAALTGGSG